MAVHGTHGLPPSPGKTQGGGTASSPTPLSKRGVASVICNGFVMEERMTMQPGECLPYPFITGRAGNKIQQIFVQHE